MQAPLLGWGCCRGRCSLQRCSAGLALPQAQFTLEAARPLRRQPAAAVAADFLQKNWQECITENKLYTAVASQPK